jgi:hypothetical protein
MILPIRRISTYTTHINKYEQNAILFCKTKESRSLKSGILITWKGLSCRVFLTFLSACFGMPDAIRTHDLQSRSGFTCLLNKLIRRFRFPCRVMKYGLTISNFRSNFEDWLDSHKFPKSNHLHFH